MVFLAQGLAGEAGAGAGAGADSGSLDPAELFSSFSSGNFGSEWSVTSIAERPRQYFDYNIFRFTEPNKQISPLLLPSAKATKTTARNKASNFIVTFEGKWCLSFVDLTFYTSCILSCELVFESLNFINILEQLIINLNFIPLRVYKIIR